MAPAKSPIWLDNNILVNIDQGRMPNFEVEITKLQKDGHEVLLPPAVEIEFLYGEQFRAADTVRRKALLTRLGLDVDTMVNHVPMQQLRAWRDYATSHGLSIGDANIIAQVRASAQVRGIRNPIFYTRETGGTLKAMRARGVMAIEFKASSTGTEIPAHLKAPMPKEVPKPPIGSLGPEAFLSEAKAGLFKAGLKAGLKDLVSAENIAAMIPDVILAVADKAAAREAVRVIKDKFKREGVAKGIAAGVMGWTEKEVASNLMNHVTPFRLEGLQDPAGLLPYTYMLKLAEAQENYAVAVAYYFSSSKSSEWKKEMQGKGFGVLRESRYYFGEDPEALFEYDFIDKLAWALRRTTDSMIKK
jgi:hypothetical protein